MARGGSKGLPGKNLLDVGGRPMIVWSVLAGQESCHIDRLILSSDDEAIISAARTVGCEIPFIRPAHLADDTASAQDVLIHALDSLNETFDYLVLLQATSPLRTADDIDGAIALCEQSGAPSCVSVTTPSKPPYWMYHVDRQGHMERILPPPTEADRRQGLPPVFVLNGAVYVVRVDWFRKCGRFVTDETRAFFMPPERSVDVDTRQDWLLAHALMKDGAGPSVQKERMS